MYNPSIQNDLNNSIRISLFMTHKQFSFHKHAHYDFTRILRIGVLEMCSICIRIDLIPFNETPLYSIYYCNGKL